ncbi:LysR family transcriptional regulator [Tatumella citrea]|uniref:LysR family transcriptional regulator n=1 Tax=Tatumella citrea TaxID=53336 RepID=A0A1Y0LN01_TATCI|nr:LysR family transcriptional regulator [Tatumella citrea]ARU95363.1 LysR family transcriptional regulator [Tatumella citrea]ARU99404.1 LysR family transcriptional regulator [Tatumella citrea]
MLNWEDLRYLLAVAEAGSLSGAARRLAVDHATVSRRLNSLETSLNSTLIRRSTRSCSVTPFGQQILGMARRMEEAAFAIERSARAEQELVAGNVTISAPPVLATHMLAGSLQLFRERYPQIQLSIVSQAARISLSRREADIALRLARPVDNNDVARKLGAMPFSLYAHRDYPQKNQPADWAFIGYGSQYATMPHARWIVAAADGRPVSCAVSDITSQLMAAKSGAGVASLPQFIGDVEPELQRLPFSGELFAPEIWLVVHADLRGSPLLRRVLDFVGEVVTAKGLA